MDIERFKALIVAYGADAARWPDAERAAALAFVETSPEAQDLLKHELTFDRLLDAAPTQPASRALEDRILATFTARTAARKQTWRAWLALRWAPAAALACSLVLGLLVGAALPGLVGIEAADADPALMVFGGPDPGLLDELGGGG